MFKVQELREIIKLVDGSTIDEFVYENEGAKIKLKKSNGVLTEVVAPKKEVAAPVVQQTPVAVAAPAPKAEEVKVEEVKATPVNVDDSSLHKITSPMVGTFYQAPSPDAPAYVKVGDVVGDESIVCIVEAMKLFNEIEAEIKGEIVEVLVKDGQLVEYGQPLFLVKPE
ncbi:MULTISPECIES: acetyl-CoA carboxylase biotin carboxyl carrier protein [Lysinibacillus]|uniref:Biotin carboxyl carrier protein of acetyl-CoA carboxylase n=1 Tax=Lysinibacillus antri TaxID=2498145 RepID=A0A432LG65_9BACI|nr:MULTISPECIES: acetyl-CoA carboxylase biotin carboxyl carrier protein [Lysinibacillus]RUL56935.1 acetyl-CoA carboxylase biotin carboxyl carrier protein [Lysinibacillus antri]TSI08576.1 acetyl-CoA carboxylase biotin carboxyl carrier protein [Lysinibacillus sp. BW-2-10]